MPLIGRDDALAWLDARHRESRARFSAAHLIGEAGAGKTRVLDEFAARCAAQGDFVVRVGTDPTWAKVSDYALRAAIRGLTGLPPEATGSAWSDARPEAKRGLERLFGSPENSGTSPRASDRRAWVAEALRWALQRAAARGDGASTVVLAIDDLDFVDGASRNAFVDLLAAPAAVPVLVVVTYAPNRQAGLDALPGERWVLKPLPVEAFATWLGAPPPTRQSTLLPLHAEQLVAWARETQEAPPDSVADLLVRRTQRLSADARLALHAIAVWGDDADVEVLRGMLPPTVEVGAAIDALERTGLIVIETTALRVVHPLVRRVISASIPAGVKRDLYERAANLRTDAPLEVRAKQAIHGGSAFEALMLLDSLSARRAACGDLAGSVSALRHALDVARRELHRDELDDPVSAVLIFARKLAEALSASGQWSDAEGVLNEALGLAPPASDHRAHLLAVLAQVASSRSQPREARKYIDEALRVARQSNSRTLLPILERLDKAIAVA
jgi:serine/threonine-protein kinase